MAEERTMTLQEQFEELSADIETAEQECAELHERWNKAGVRLQDLEAKRNQVWRAMTALAR
jgi:chromosome segregation ATPase